jgi:hypothetical protein
MFATHYSKFASVTVSEDLPLPPSELHHNIGTQTILNSIKIMKEQRKSKLILREPEHMLVSNGHTCAEFARGSRPTLQDTRCVL